MHQRKGSRREPVWPLWVRGHDFSSVQHSASPSSAIAFRKAEALVRGSHGVFACAVHLISPAAHRLSQQQPASTRRRQNWQFRSTRSRAAPAPAKRASARCCDAAWLPVRASLSADALLQPHLDDNSRHDTHEQRGSIATWTRITGCVSLFPRSHAGTAAPSATSASALRCATPRSPSSLPPDRLALRRASASGSCPPPCPARCRGSPLLRPSRAPRECCKPLALGLQPRPPCSARTTGGSV